MPAAFGDSRLPARFWDKVEVQPNGCWLWTATLMTNGYAWFVLDATRSGKKLKQRYAGHQVAYEALVGPIPPGLELDHLCHSEDADCRLAAACPHRRCVNPAHLEAVTRRENLLRGRTIAAAYAERDSCSRGHPFDEVNTAYRADGRGHARRCRACDREKARARRAA